MAGLYFPHPSNDFLKTYFTNLKMLTYGIVHLIREFFFYYLVAHGVDEYLISMPSQTFNRKKYLTKIKFIRKQIILYLYRLNVNLTTRTRSILAHAEVVIFSERSTKIYKIHTTIYIFRILQHFLIMQTFTHSKMLFRPVLIISSFGPHWSLICTGFAYFGSTPIFCGPNMFEFA